MMGSNDALEAKKAASHRVSRTGQEVWVEIDNSHLLTDYRRLLEEARGASGAAQKAVIGRALQSHLHLTAPQTDDAVRGGSEDPLLISSDADNNFKASSSRLSQNGHASSSRARPLEVAQEALEQSEDAAEGSTDKLQSSRGKFKRKVVRSSSSEAEEAKPSSSKGKSKGGTAGSAARRRESSDNRSKDKGKAKAEEGRRKSKAEKRSKKERRRLGNDSEDDLKSNLNADAFALSTAPKVRQAFTNNLKQFKEARKAKSKGVIVVDSDSGTSSASSLWNSESVSSDSSDDSDSSADFVARDDEVIGEDGRVIRKKAFKEAPRLNLLPPARVARLSLQEAAEEWMRFIILKILDVQPPSAARTDQLWAARKQIQQHLEDSARVLSTSARRRQFMWYLGHYPVMKRRSMFSSEIKEHRGCGACHRSKQKCDSKVIFSGSPYDRGSLYWLESDEDREIESDISSTAEDAVEHIHFKDESKTYKTRHAPPKKAHVFWLGSHCANVAKILHELTHCEYAWLQRSANLDEVNRLKEKLHRLGDVDKLKEHDIEMAVRAGAFQIKNDMLRLRNDANAAAGAR